MVGGQSPSSLEWAVFTSAWALVLPPPSKMCLLLERLAPKPRDSWELSLVGVGARSRDGISRELGVRAGLLIASHAHFPTGTEQAKAFVVC